MRPGVNKRNTQRERPHFTPKEAQKGEVHVHVLGTEPVSNVSFGPRKTRPWVPKNPRGTLAAGENTRFGDWPPW